MDSKHLCSFQPDTSSSFAFASHVDQPWICYRGNYISILHVIGHVATPIHALPSKQRNNQAITTKSHPPVLLAVNQENSADSTGVMQNSREQSWARVICDLATNLFPNSKYQTEDLFPQGGKTVRHLFKNYKLPTDEMVTNLIPELWENE